MCVGWWSEMAWIIDGGLGGYGPNFCPDWLAASVDKVVSIRSAPLKQNITSMSDSLTGIHKSWLVVIGDAYKLRGRFACVVC